MQFWQVNKSIFHFHTHGTRTMSDDEPDTDLPEDDEGMYERLVSHDSAEGFHRHERFAHTERLASQGRHMHHPCGKWALTKLGPFYCAVAVCVCVVSAFGLLSMGYFRSKSFNARTASSLSSSASFVWESGVVSSAISVGV